MLFQIQTNENHLFDKMWDDYTKELKIENPENFKMIENRSDFLIIEENETVGFVLLGTYPNSITPFDCFIQDFYIKPEFRNKGYARNTIKDILSNHFIISMYILKTNTKGRDFWNYVFRRFNFEDRLSFGKATNEDETATLHLWVPKNLEVERKHMT